MELTDIMALVKAGYTKDEIAQMEKPEPIAPNPVPAVQPVATPVPVAEPTNPPAQVVEPVAVPAPAPVPQPAQQEAQPTMAELMQSIAKLTSAVQANAIAQSVIPAGVSNPLPTAKDMLAEIIRPTFHQRGE
jgi:hypothetical protein